MRHRKLTFKIGRTTAHRKALLANGACSLLKSRRITTTVTKAKQIRRLAERMITLGKDGSLHARRRAVAILGQKDVVATLFREIAPDYEQRAGGYTRIMHLGTRVGDAAPVCILELVEPDSAVAAATGAAEGDSDAGTAQE